MNYHKQPDEKDNAIKSLSKEISILYRAKITAFRDGVIVGAVLGIVIIYLCQLLLNILKGV